MKKIFAVVVLLITMQFGFAQKTKTNNTTVIGIDPLYFKSMNWRCIGPFRAGRSLAVCGVVGNNSTYYFGATGGGIWKTTDGGGSWVAISDTNFHSSSVGAIAVAPSNSNIIYAGMGEVEMRNNISFGDGMYKSIDAGKTWKHIGLINSYAIGNIVVNPTNPDVLFVSVMGKVFGANPERGVYRSKDGGNSWQQVLSINDSTGSPCVVMDPSNTDILYASLWQAHRTPYDLSSGGKSCGLYKSTDGGNTWKNISQNPGLPKGMLGKIMVSVSPVNHDLIWAMVENENGGLFKSEDGGATWNQINTDKNLRQRPWYFSGVFADSKDINTVYVLNVGAWKSINGGKSFTPINVNHGDNHDLWIDPNNNQRMILGDDGGAEVSTDGSMNWTPCNVPTAQFYHVNLDNDFMYHVYGDQQDNSSVCIASRTDGYSIDRNDWYPVAGGESGYIVPDPSNSEVTFGGGYDGSLTMFNHGNQQNQDISVWPVAAIGSGAIDKKYRFQWTYPIIISPFDPGKMYVASQYVHVSTDRGMSWTTISPDLTRNDSSKLKPSGGPITKDNTGAEIYCTIFSFAESYVQQGVLWAGNDDGLVNVSVDNGKTWNNVTPKQLPDWALITQIDPSHFDGGTCYISATRYKSDDTKPYLFKTIDFGKTWTLIVTGIPDGSYCRCIRNDPKRKGLLYAGTETGIYLSADDGAHWQSFNLNLPLTPVHDIQVQTTWNDLVIATHGRSFWILDDLTPIYNWADNQVLHKITLLKPRDAFRTHGGSYFFEGMQTGQNAPQGVLIHYTLPGQLKDELQLKFFTDKGDTVNSYSSKKTYNGDPVKVSGEFYEEKNFNHDAALTVDSGMNTFEWDMHYPDATGVDGPTVLWSGGLAGPQAAPGIYSVQLIVKDSVVATQTFEIKKDPRTVQYDGDIVEQVNFLLKVNHKLSETNKAINQLRDLRTKLNNINGSITDTAVAKKFTDFCKPILDTLSKVEDALIQWHAKAGQDLLNYPIKLNDKLAGIGSAAGSADKLPTKQCYDAYTDIAGQIDVQLNKIKNIVTNQLPVYNQMMEQYKVYELKVN